MGSKQSSFLVADWPIAAPSNGVYGGRPFRFVPYVVKEGDVPFPVAADGVLDFGSVFGDLPSDSHSKFLLPDSYLEALRALPPEVQAEMKVFESAELDLRDVRMDDLQKSDPPVSTGLPVGSSEQVDQLPSETLQVTPEVPPSLAQAAGEPLANNLVGSLPLGVGSGMGLQVEPNPSLSEETKVESTTPVASRHESSIVAPVPGSVLSDPVPGPLLSRPDPEFELRPEETGPAPPSQPPWALGPAGTTSSPSKRQRSSPTLLVQPLTKFFQSKCKDPPLSPPLGDLTELEEKWAAWTKDGLTSVCRTHGIVLVVTNKLAIIKALVSRGVTYKAPPKEYQAVLIRPAAAPSLATGQTSK